MLCKHCSSNCQKAGKQKNGTQKWHCLSCKKYQQLAYRYKAYDPDINKTITNLLKEGVGIRGISRLLDISTKTVMTKILRISQSLNRPTLFYGKEYEMDEVCTYIKKKSRKVWIAYALRRDTREVVDFRIGSRTNHTLKGVIDTMKLGFAKKIFTDKLRNYKHLIEQPIHSTKFRGTNSIERMNLNLRTHLKRLSRRSICFSKSMVMLSACLKIYFWT